MRTRFSLLLAVAVLLPLSVLSGDRRDSKKSAVVIKAIEIRDMKDASLLFVRNGCSVKDKRNRKKLVDCYAYLFNGVVGTSIAGKEVALENVLIFPSMLERKAAEELLEIILGKLEVNGMRLPDETSVQISRLRYLEKEVRLSAITEVADDPRLVHWAGLDVSFRKVVRKDGFVVTLNQDTTMGLDDGSSPRRFCDARQVGGWFQRELWMRGRARGWGTSDRGLHKS